MKEKLLVLGVGNILLNDEGIGVEAINHLKKKEISNNIEVVDGGTGGFHLLSLFNDYSKMIIVDACLDNNPPGTVSLIKPRYSSDFPKTISAHDLGLKDMIEAAQLMEKMPEIHLITVSIKANQDMDMKVSEDIKKSIPEVISLIEKIVNEYK